MSYSVDRFVGILLVAVLAFSALITQLLPIHTVAAEQPDTVPEASDELKSEDDERALTPEPLVLLDERPQSTSGQDLMPSGATLTWTPTGKEVVQDTYDIRISQVRNAETGGLEAPYVDEKTGLTEAKYDATGFTDGTYYWQVKSCNVTGQCRDWSDIWTVTIDGAVPAAPAGLVSSDVYDRNVTFAGTAEAGTTVVVMSDDDICSGIVDTDGRWGCGMKQAFEYGTYEARVTVVDKAGNISQEFVVPFTVKELFVAEPITLEVLPVVLSAVPVDESVRDKVSVPTMAKVTDVNMGIARMSDDLSKSDAPAPLSTDGGIVQASESGWYVFGMPWFVWLGSVGGAASAWWAFGWPVPRRFGSSSI